MAAILTHHRNGFFCRKIFEALIQSVMASSSMIVSLILREFLSTNQGNPKPLKRLGPQYLPSKCTKDLVEKVDLATDSDNPPTQIALARRHGVSKTTIRRVLKEHLKVTLLKKTKTHVFSGKQAQRRREKENDLLKLL